MRRLRSLTISLAVCLATLAGCAAEPSAPDAAMGSLQIELQTTVGDRVYAVPSWLTLELQPVDGGDPLIVDLQGEGSRRTEVVPAGTYSTSLRNDSGTDGYRLLRTDPDGTVLEVPAVLVSELPEVITISASDPAELLLVFNVAVNPTVETGELSPAIDVTEVPMSPTAITFQGTGTGRRPRRPGNAEYARPALPDFTTERGTTEGDTVTFEGEVRIVTDFSPVVGGGACADVESVSLSADEAGWADHLGELGSATGEACFRYSQDGTRVGFSISLRASGTPSRGHSDAFDLSADLSPQLDAWEPGWEVVIGTVLPDGLYDGTEVPFVELHTPTRLNGSATRRVGVVGDGVFENVYEYTLGGGRVTLRLL